MSDSNANDRNSPLGSAGPSKVSRCKVLLFCFAGVAILVAAVLPLVRFIQADMRIQGLLQIGVALRQYVEANGKLPPIQHRNNTGCSAKRSWRVDIEPYLDRMPPDSTSAFAFISEDSVWLQQAKMPLRELFQRFGKQVVVIFLPSRVRGWDDSCNIVLRNGIVELEENGKMDAPLDLRGAFVLRLNGAIERIPTDMSDKDVLMSLKEHRSFIDSPK